MMGRRNATSVSLFEAAQVHLVARLFARVLLKRSEGLRAAPGISPHSQRLLLEASGRGGAALGGQPRCGWCGFVGRQGVRLGGRVAEVEQSLSVFGPQQVHDGTRTWFVCAMTEDRRTLAGMLSWQLEVLYSVLCRVQVQPCRESSPSMFLRWPESSWWRPPPCCGSAWTMWPLEFLRASANAGLVPERRRTSTDGRRRRTGRKSFGRTGGGKIWRKTRQQ